MWPITVILFATSVSGYNIIAESNNELIWPSAYYLQGEKTDIIIGIKETFEIWYNEHLNRSRVSYYDRTDSTYYYGGTDDNPGSEYRVYPVTSADLEITVTCSEESHYQDAEDFLPSIGNFSYEGTKQFNNKAIKVWKSYASDEDAVIEKILYVYTYGEEHVSVPVRYEYKTYNQWTKSLNGHTITEYRNFKAPDSKDLDVANVPSCGNASIGMDLEKALNFYRPDVSSGLNKAFHTYKHHHRRQYDNAEHEMRKRIFEKNWRQVIAHNKMNLSYKMAINHFSDRTPEELRRLTATYPNPYGKGSVAFPHSEEELEAMVEDLPENYNMVNDGVISRVKNQGDCGSCWAFSTTAAVEGALARSNGGRNIDLCEQSLVDCAWGYSNYGCSGGLLDTAFKYILEYGIPSEREYGSYLARNGECAVMNVTKTYKIKGFARVTPLSVNAMKIALYKYGPVAVAIYASENLSKYSSGIFYDLVCEDEKNINHGVTVVGYGVRDGTLYWVVKNSWGEEWGQDGYVLMSASNDNCLVLTQAYYPII